jgi:4-aminobutyrate aminotransferase/(S)-3-amino-2-methylpropionate transaminase
MQQVPLFDWPRAPFPNIQYPMATYEHQNRAEEDRCLQAARDLIKQRRDGKQDIGAIIIEPISAFENHIATPYYFR